jgi:hypothetical protein
MPVPYPTSAVGSFTRVSPGCLDRTVDEGFPKTSLSGLNADFHAGRSIHFPCSVPAETRLEALVAFSSFDLSESPPVLLEPQE